MENSSKPQQQRSEPEYTQTGGKKVRQKRRRKKPTSVEQPKRFTAPGTEVVKDA